MGGKTSQSSSQVQIPPEVLARYNSVNATAQNVAQTPFQQYSTNPNAFVAPLTPTQNAGVANTNAASGMAQPYFNTATGFALAGAGPVNPGQLNTSQYMNPYLQTVLGSTEAMVNQQNQQAMAGQTGNAINQGYFGGDRSGIASAVLQGQQELAGGQLYSGIASDAYQSALAAAQQQQGVGLEAGQANRAALQGAAGQLAELGTGAQGAALQGAQAQLGAGQVEQQTQQAGDTALYNQFLQQQSYPFQTAQFLANIAEGTGALSGSTTTNTQPGGLFMSDERLKEDMRPIGKGFDGANIYRFRYKDDPENVTRLGFSAQEMARHHPEAVHSVGGFGAVDQSAATEESARRGGFANAANDNGGDDREAPRMARQGGGLSEWGMYPSGANPMVIAQMLQAQEQMYGPYAQGGLYGGSASGAPHGGATGYVPQASMPVGQLQVSHPSTTPQASPLHQVAEASDDLKAVGDDASKVYNWGKQQAQNHDINSLLNAASRREPDDGSGNANGGFVRAARQDGGDINPYGGSGGLNIPTGAGGPPRQLQTPGAPGVGESALHTAGSAAGDINSLVKAGQSVGKGFNWLSSLGSTAVPFADGGFIRARDLGGGAGDPSDPHNDDPYQPKGPGLAIPTAETQHPQLAVAKPPGQGQSALDQAGSTAGDIASIAKLAMMFAARGGRIGRADGGELISPDDARLVRDAHATVAPHALPPLDLSAPAADPGTGADGDADSGAPSAGFARAATPEASGEAGGSLGHIIGLEGTGPNPRSSAIGVGQLLDKTYMGLLREAHPDIAAQVGDDPASIKAFRRTAQGLALSGELAPMNQNKNRALMEHQGIPVTPTNEHVMWILGAGDGPKVLQADPSTPLQGLISDAAIAANPSIMAGKTAGDFIGWARRGMAAGGRAGFADAGYVGDGVTNTSGGAYVDEQGNVHAAPPPAPDTAAPPSPPPDASPPAAADPKPGFVRADQTGGAGAPSALPPEVAAAAQRSDKANQDLQDLARGQTHHDVQGSNPLARAFSWATQPEHAIPLVTGIADMLAAPTKYPLVALTQGAKGGFGAYQQQRAYDLATAQSAAQQSNYGLDAVTTAYGLPVSAYSAETALRGVNAQGLNAALTYVNGFKQTGTFDTKRDPNGPLWQTPGGGGLVTRAEMQGMQARAMQDAVSRTGNVTNPLAPGALDPHGGAGVGSTAAGPMGAVADAYTQPPPGAPAAGGPATTPPPPPPPPPTAPTPHHHRGAPVPPPAAAAPQGAPAAQAGNIDQANSGLPMSPDMVRDLKNGAYQQSPVSQQLPDESQLREDSRPSEMVRRGNILLGTPGQEAVGQKLIDQANRYKNGDDTPTGADGRPNLQYQQMARQTASAGEQAAGWTKAKLAETQGTSQFTSSLPQTLQVMNALDRTYRNWNSNRWSGDFADTIGKLESIPGVRGLIGPALAQFEGTQDLRKKEAARMTIVTALANSLSHGAPAEAMHMAGQQVPAPSMAPAARYEIMAENRALIDQGNDWAKVWAANKDHVDDATTFKQRWLAEHPLSGPDGYQEKAYDGMFPYAGMTTAEMDAHPRHPQSQAELQQMWSNYPAGIPIMINGQIYHTPGHSP